VLGRVDLSCAALHDANLSYGDLRGADLRYANLRYANLRYADLSYADLRYANLSYADLRYADLRSATGNSVNLKTLQTNNWPVSYTDTVMQIGCQRHDIKAWFKFSDEEIESMAGGALEWWKEWEPVIKKIIKISPAAPTGFIEKPECDSNSNVNK